jgi:hypothetical protein
VATEYVIFLDLDGAEALQFAPLEHGGGWARYFSPDHPRGNVVRLRVGFLAPKDRAEPWDAAAIPLGIREVHFVVEGGPVSAQVVRDLPFGRIAAAVNQPRHYEVLSQAVTRNRNVKMPASGLWDSELPVLDHGENPSTRLTIPEGRHRKPDAFYQQVAAAFAWLATTSSSPATDLARENDVPVTTVHRWVKEARGRGFLPPAAGRGRRGGNG